MRVSNSSVILLLVVCARFFSLVHSLGTPVVRQENSSLNLTIGAKDFVRIRASTDESQSTFVEWTGQTLLHKPGWPPFVVFNVVGMNVARAIPLEDGGYDLLGKELQLYLDPQTNDIMHVWFNPFTSENISVIHVQNSPVYQTIPAATAYPARSMGYGYYTVTANIPLQYPNPLNPSNDPNSTFQSYQGSYQAIYSAIESFTFTFASSELSDRIDGLPSTQIYWTRSSPLLPWMKSPDTNATLLFVANGRKVPEGWRGLSPTLKAVIEKALPGFREAPSQRLSSGGGVSSWSFFTQPDVFADWRNGTDFPIPEGQEPQFGRKVPDFIWNTTTA